MKKYIIIRISQGSFEMNAKVIDSCMRAKSKNDAIKKAYKEYPRMTNFGRLIAIEK